MPFSDDTGPVYVYDGSFHGLLTVAHETLKQKHLPEDVIVEGERAPLLFTDYVTLAADEARAEQMITAVRQRLQKTAYRNVLYGFLSGSPGSARAVVNYIYAGRRLGRNLDLYCTHELVKPLLDLSARVAKESHRMLGLVRFRRTSDGIFYAPVETDHNVLPLIAGHFARRMQGERWIIHDTKRNTAVLHEKGRWEITGFDVTGTISYSSEELLYRELWNSFFNTIAISERRNKKLQRQLLPKRYWKYLVEEIS